MKSKKQTAPEKQVREGLTAFSDDEEMVEIINQSNIHPQNTLNDLTAKEWIAETVSVWTQKGLGANHADAQIEKQHPAPFSFTDVSRLIRLFTKKGQVVLDPFVGIGSTLKACVLEGRKGIGFELNPRYAKLTKERLEKEVNTLFAQLYPQEIQVGDARLLVKKLKENSIDFVITSPPYWNILHKQDHKVKQERVAKDLDTKYSDDELDLGNIHDYSKFLYELGETLGNCVKALRGKKYMAVIVSDFREKSKYVMFHAHLAEELKKYKLELRGIKILYQRHKRIFPYGYPYAYVPNIHHQYILILQNTK
jgi:DNA modification methylase